MPCGIYVASVTWKGKDVRGQLIDLGPGAEPLHVIVKDGLGQVHGKVEEDASAIVLLVPQKRTEVSVIHTANCGPDGSFRINGIMPGDYYIAAFPREGAPPMDWNALPEAIVRTASSLRIDANTHEFANLEIVQWPW